MTSETRRRLLQAIADHDSTAFDTPSGAILELLSSLARSGELDDFGAAIVAFCDVHGSATRKLLSHVPSLLLNGYLYLHRQRAAGSLQEWCGENSNWSDRVRGAALHPERLVALIAQFEESIRELEAH